MDSFGPCACMGCPPTATGPVLRGERRAGDSPMDIVPVIMAVEERFGVTLPDEGGWSVTVGDLYLSLLAQTRRPAPAPCPTSQAFYRLRRTLTGEFGVDRRRVRPGTRLCHLFPAASRGATWPRLAAA